MLDSLDYKFYVYIPKYVDEGMFLKYGIRDYRSILELSV